MIGRGIIMKVIKLYRISIKLYLRGIPILPRLIKGLIYLKYNSIILYTTEIGNESKLAYGGNSIVIYS